MLGPFVSVLRNSGLTWRGLPSAMPLVKCHFAKRLGGEVASAHESGLHPPLDFGTQQPKPFFLLCLQWLVTLSQASL